MGDSDSKKTEGQPGETSAPSEEIIVRRGVPVQIAREGGKFIRQKKNMPDSREFTRTIRNRLNHLEADKTGRMLKGSKTVFLQMVDNITSIARCIPTILDNGDTVERDAKQDMAAVQAFKEITMRGLGQPPKSDEEIEAGKTQGVRMVIVLPPEEMMNKMILEDKPKPALKPAFIEAEVVENK